MIHLILLLSLIFPLSVFAQTPSPSDSPNVPIGEIQKIREAIQEKVKEKLSEINQPTSYKKAIIGQISQLNVPTSMDITLNGESSTVLLDPEIVFINSKKSKSNIDTLKVGDQVLALGIYEPITQQLTVKRLVSFDFGKDLSPLPQTLYGTITDISQSTDSVFLSLTPQNDKNQQYQIATNNTTKYLDSALKAQLSPKIMIGQKLIIVAAKSQKSQNSWVAQKIVIRTTPVSASPSPSPSPVSN